MTTVMTKVGEAPHHELFTPDADYIVIVVPEEGFKDTPDVSRIMVTTLCEYAQKLGKKCGLVIIANNLLAQEPESRRIYAEGVTSDLFFGIVMVVTSPLARIIGNIATRLSTLQVPLYLADSIESGITWLESQRKA